MWIYEVARVVFGMVLVTACNVQAGISQSVTSSSPKQFDQARAEMLKLVLISCSQTLFVTPDDYKANENKWLSYFTSRSAPQAQLLVQSLCAVIFSYDPVGMHPHPHSSLHSAPHRPRRAPFLDAACCVSIGATLAVPPAPAPGRRVDRAVAC